jgi:M6 family metalloprotease-like protein
MTPTNTLYKWWDPDRLDNFTTADAGWAGRPGDVRSPNYRFAGEEGSIFDSGSPQPPETVPLVSWWDPDRKDNIATSDAAWRGGPGETRTPNYHFSRVEGYLFSRPVAGTWPLYRWWSPGRTDNHTTIGWLPDEDGRYAPDYVRGHLEGYAMPHNGALSFMPATPLGYRPGFLRTRRPLLVILLEFVDARLSQPDAFYESLVFGPGGTNLVEYFSEISYRQFLWARAGLVRVSFSRPSAVELDAGFSERLMRRVAERGFDYARFDSDGDGIVTAADLGVLRIVANYSPGVFAGGSAGLLPPMRIGGVQLRLESSNCDENGDIVLFAHELFHQLIDDPNDEHIYGPGRALNYKASLFAANSTRAASDAGPVHLDPWNKMRAGWMSPRVVPITDAGGVALIDATQEGSPPDNSRAPIAFYDPRRGTDELFIVEYRTPATPRHPDGSYDSTVLGQGVAVWYVQREANGSTPTFNWPPPVVPVAGGNMWANYLVGPAGPGKGPFWKRDNGEFSLQWGDGSDSALRLHVDQGSPGSPFAVVQWRHRDQPFLPRIDSVLPERARRGATLILDGVFGIRDSDARVVIESARGARPLVINSWSPGRLSVRIGDDVDAGAGMIRVFSDAAPASGGNPVPFVVEP